MTPAAQPGHSIINQPATAQPTPNRRARREQAIAHLLMAAALADEDGWVDGAVSFRANAARMRKALES